MTLSWSDSYFGQLRALAGDRTLLLTATRVVARDEAGRVLLIQRADNGVWSVPAGAMELGESVADCASRELWEETGLRAAELTPFALHTGPAYTSANMFGDTYQHFVVLFRADKWHGELVRATDETTDAGFFPAAEPPEPLSRTVAETLADLASFEANGQLVVK
ncbi:MAG: NUDIX domain-containing protein [Micromonosporaceae bacterium]|nr:NUDIX domain-containing protein [Micromonosporaceae bacterium]